MTLRLPFAGYTIDWTEAAHALLFAGGSLLIAAVVHRLLFAVLARVTARTHTPVDGLIVDQLRAPARWAGAAVALSVASQGDPWVAYVWGAVARFVVPALLGWIVYSMVCAFASALEARADAFPFPRFSDLNSFVIVPLLASVTPFSSSIS